ncbi:MAG: hypothetical protein Q4D96_10625 [Propionibacteriaceae bacterium]|nr:hypothetical protein [Propionibacteriaceae bacterium]
MLISMLVTVFDEELLGLLLGDALLEDELLGVVELLDSLAAGVEATDSSTAGAGSGLFGAQDTAAHMVTTPSRAAPRRLVTGLSNRRSSIFPRR